MTISGWQEIESDGSPMGLYVSTPPGVGPFPALVVMQHQGGVALEVLRNGLELGHHALR